MKVCKKVESNADKSGRTKKSGDSARNHRRFKLADAWREVGLNELEVANTMAGLVQDLTGKEHSAKTLLDAVKESIRVLEPPKATVRAGASDVPVTVILDHDVPRPAFNNSRRSRNRRGGRKCYASSKRINSGAGCNIYGGTSATKTGICRSSRN